MAQEQARTQIGVDQLLTISLQGLDGLFFKGHKDKAKKLYKEIHDGKTVDFGSISFKEGNRPALKLKLKLDYSQFIGHLTFHTFRVALQQTLKHIAQKLEKKADLRVFSSDDDREIIIFTPGIIQQDETINVMVVGVEPANQAAIIKVQFLDPEQFKKSEEGKTADNPVAEVPSEE